MPSQALKSSFLKHATHNNDALTIEYKNGKRFRYQFVPMAEYVKLCNSPMAGQYYTENIKGKYRSQLLQKHQA